MHSKGLNLQSAKAVLYSFDYYSSFSFEKEYSRFIQPAFVAYTGLAVTA